MTGGRAATAARGRVTASTVILIDVAAIRPLGFRPDTLLSTPIKHQKGNVPPDIFSCSLGALPLRRRIGLILCLQVPGAHSGWAARPQFQGIARLEFHAFYTGGGCGDDRGHRAQLPARERTRGASAHPMGHYCVWAFWDWPTIRLPELDFWCWAGPGAFRDLPGRPSTSRRIYSVFRKAIRSSRSREESFKPNSCPWMGPGPRWKPRGT